jgi:beta-phosphoglucomutase family hydrolase
MTNIKGLIFDLDGTLTLSQQYHYQAFAKVFKKYGITYTKEEDKYEYAGKGSRCTFPEVFAKHGRKLTDEEIEKLSNEKKEVYDRIISKAKIKGVPGVKTFLERMKKHGRKMIVASGNKAESIDFILKKTKLRKYFDVFITNKDVKKSKPAPDIFLAAAKKLGLKPHECIVFEDAVNGIHAAKAGGIPCVALATGIRKKDLAAAGAKMVVTDYNSISDIMLFGKNP